MNDQQFQGMTAIVTGGAQGIGEAVARRLNKGGARIALWDLDQDLANRTAQTLDNAIALNVDISDWNNVESAFAKTLEALGRIDILVNSAGIAGSNAPVDEYPVDEFARIVAVNLNGTFYVNRAVVPSMRTQAYGRIVNIASVAVAGRQSQCIRLFRVQGRCDRLYQVARQGTRGPRHRGQLRYPGSGANTHLRSDGANPHRLHAFEDPARPVP